MIQNKLNRNSQGSGLQLGNVDSGCCLSDELTACLYRFQFATTPASFTTITVDGVAYEFVHTYSTPEALEVAIIETLQMPVVEGGAGMVVHPNDIKVFLDSFATTADRLTIEMISGVVITNFITNVGTQASATPVCTQQTMCVHRTTYVLGAAIDIVISNTPFTLTTYATVALLRTALLAEITNLSLTGQVKISVRQSATSGVADVWIYTKPNVTVYHNDVVVPQLKCSAHYV